MITVKLFGIARDIVGQNKLTIDQEVKDVDALLTYVKQPAILRQEKGR